jgi:hypothetical protein
MSYRSISFHYRVLRNGADFGRIFPVDGGWPRIRMDGSGEIKTSLSGTFLPPDADVDWFGDEIAPEMILNGETYPLIGIRAAIVDGVTIKADTWYTVRNGEFVEVEDNN